MKIRISIDSQFLIDRCILKIRIAFDRQFLIDRCILQIRISIDSQCLIDSRFLQICIAFDSQLLIDGSILKICISIDSQIFINHRISFIINFYATRNIFSNVFINVSTIHSISTTIFNTARTKILDFRIIYIDIFLGVIGIFYIQSIIVLQIFNGIVDIGNLIICILFRLVKNICLSGADACIGIGIVSVNVIDF